MFTKVLVPLDGTEDSEGILPLVSLLAEHTGMEVVLARALDFNHLTDVDEDSAFVRLLRSLNEGGLTLPFETDSEAEPWAAQLLTRIERGIKAPLDGIALRLQAEGINAEAALGYGPAATTIVRMANDSGCDLIAMSTRRRGLLSRRLLGSVTYKVVHESPLPMLVVSPEFIRLFQEQNRPVHRIVVPVDGSAFSEAVLPYATALAAKMDLRVSLLRVLEERSIELKEGILTEDMLSEVESQSKTTAQAYLTRVALGPKAAGLQVEEVLLSGRASSEILEFAGSAEDAIVALTTHGRSGVNRLLLGSIAEAVVRESVNPVLMVRPDSPP